MMYYDNKFDDLIDFLCTCAADQAPCEWHRRLRGPHDIRWELGEEMEDIFETSHAIDRGMEPPPGWEQIHGKYRAYWAPRDRGF